jgi:hypothetical protein
MKKLMVVWLLYAAGIMLGIASAEDANVSKTFESRTGEHLFGLGCAMGWAEMNALRDVPTYDLIGGFRSNREIARSMGYPPEIIERFDSILTHLTPGSSTRVMYEDIRDLRIQMQNLSGTLFNCILAGGKGGDIRTSLDGLRWEIRCSAGGGDYWCDCSDPDPVSTVLAGPKGTTYDVTLRFHGIVEQKTYYGGTNDGSFWQEGGDPAQDTYNVYKLEISSPHQVYYLNRGRSDIHYCFGIDYTKTVRMTVGATVTLVAQALDGRQIRNRNEAGNPIIMGGSEAFNGQYIRMDVINVSPVR